MNQDLEIRSEVFPMAILGPAGELANKIARTEFVPRALQGKPEAVLACILTGNELGIGPMQALAKIHVIESRPAMSAELMRALVLSKGHELWTEEYTTQRVTICGKRAGSDNVQRVTWTSNDAKAAKLDFKDVWKKYPRAMLLARATGELCRLIFADVLGGVSYTEEEIKNWDVLEDEDEEEPTQVTHERQLEAPSTPAKKAPAKRQPAKAKPPQEQPPEPDLEDIAEGTTEAPAELARNLVQRIVILSKEVGLDHHALNLHITEGRAESTKELTNEEAGKAIDLLTGIREGRYVAQLDGDVIVSSVAADGPPEPELEDEIVEAELVEETPYEPREPVLDWFKEEDWRSFMKERGLRVADVLRVASTVAGENEMKAPGSLGSLVKDMDLVELVADRMEWSA